MMEERLKNCRIAGPIFLAIGAFFWYHYGVYSHPEKGPDVEQVITIPIKLCKYRPCRGRN